MRRWHATDGAVAGDAGVVDEDIDTAVAHQVMDSGDQGVDGAVGREIAGQGVASDGGCDGAECIAAGGEVDTDHPRPFFCEAPRDRFADAARSPGDEGDLAGEGARTCHGAQTCDATIAASLDVVGA